MSGIALKNVCGRIFSGRSTEKLHFAESGYNRIMTPIQLKNHDDTIIFVRNIIL